MWGRKKKTEQDKSVQDNSDISSVVLDTKMEYKVQRIMDCDQSTYFARAYSDYVYKDNDIVIVWHYDHWDVCRIIQHPIIGSCPDYQYGVIVGHIDNFNEKLTDLKQDWMRTIESNITDVTNKQPYGCHGVEYSIVEMKDLKSLWHTYRSLANKDYC